MDDEKNSDFDVSQNYGSFSHLNLSDFPTYQEISQYISLDFSFNPIENLGTLPPLPILEYINLEGTKLSSFLNAQKQPCLRSMDIKGTPISFYPDVNLMCVVVFGPWLEEIDGKKISLKDYQLANDVGKKLRPLLVSGWLVTSVYPIKLVHYKTHKFGKFNDLSINYEEKNDNMIGYIKEIENETNSQRIRDKFSVTSRIGARKRKTDGTHSKNIISLHRPSLHEIRKAYVLENNRIIKENISSYEPNSLSESFLESDKNVGEGSHAFSKIAKSSFSKSSPSEMDLPGMIRSNSSMEVNTKKAKQIISKRAEFKPFLHVEFLSKKSTHKSPMISSQPNLLEIDLHNPISSSKLKPENENPFGEEPIATDRITLIYQQSPQRSDNLDIKEDKDPNKEQEPKAMPTQQNSDKSNSPQELDAKKRKRKHRKDTDADAKARRHHRHTGEERAADGQRRKHHRAAHEEPVSPQPRKSVEKKATARQESAVPIIKLNSSSSSADEERSGGPRSDVSALAALSRTPKPPPAEDPPAASRREDPGPGAPSPPASLESLRSLVFGASADANVSLRARRRKRRLRPGTKAPTPLIPTIQLPPPPAAPLRAGGPGGEGAPGSPQQLTIRVEPPLVARRRKRVRNSEESPPGGSTSTPERNARRRNRLGRLWIKLKDGELSSDVELADYHAGSGDSPRRGGRLTKKNSIDVIELSTHPITLDGEADHESEISSSPLIKFGIIKF